MEVDVAGKIIELSMGHGFRGFHGYVSHFWKISANP
jgi:hypothetical protein